VQVRPGLLLLRPGLVGLGVGGAPVVEAGQLGFQPLQPGIGPLKAVQTFGGDHLVMGSV